MAPTPQQILDTYKQIIQRGFDEYISKDIRDALANGLQLIFENAGSAGVSNDHVFESVATRDNYFDPDRLTELQAGVPIITQTGTAATPVVLLQIWNGTSSPPTYDATNWDNYGDLSLLQYVSYDPNALSGNGEVSFSRGIFAPSVRTDPGTIRLGSIAIDSANHAIGAYNLTTDERGVAVFQRFNDTGFAAPRIIEAGAITTVDRQLLFNEVQPSVPYSYTYTLPAGDDVFWSGLILRPSEAGMFEFTIRSQDANGAIVSIQRGFEFDGSDVGVETTVMLNNPLIFEENEVFHITLEGARLQGSTIGGTWLPFFRSRERNITSYPILATTADITGSQNFAIVDQASDTFTITSAQRGQYLRYTGATDATWTLPAASGLTNLYGLYITASTNQITLQRAGTDTIDGNTNIIIEPGEIYVIARSSATAYVSLQIDGDAVSIQGVAVSTTTPTDGQVLQYDNNTSTYVPGTITAGSATINFSIQKEATQAYTIVDADRGEFLEYTGTSAGTWTLPAASGLATGWGIYITASGAAITLSPNGTDTIDGNASLTFAVGDTYVLSRSGSTTWASYRVDGNAIRIQGVAVSTTAPTDNQVLQYDNATSAYVPGTITAGSATVDFSIQKEATQSYTIVNADRGEFLEYTGTSAGTWTLPAASGLATGWGIYITASGAAITLNRAGSDTIDGNTSLAIAHGETYVIARSGSTTWTSYRIDGNAIRIQGIAVSSTTPSNGQVLKYNSTSTQYEPAEDATGMAAVNYSINEQSGAYTILSADRGQYLRYTGNTNGTWTVPESSTLTTGFGTFVSTDTNQLTLNRSGSDTIDGLSAIIVPPRSTYLLSRASSSTFLTYVVDGNALAFQSIAVATTTPSDNQVLQYNATAQQYQPATISGTTPAVLSLHNFSINIPSTIETNTSLGSRTVTYSVTNYSLLTALQLQVNGANVASITLPTSDGQHTASVDLSSVDTSSATTLVFRLQGNASINSNTQTVTVVAPTAMERLYWGVETDNVASTFDTDAAQNQTALSGNIALPTFTGSQYVKLAYPASADPVTSLSIGGLNQLGAFTLSEDALTINTVQYDVLVSNNALDGAVVSGTIITITR